MKQSLVIGSENTPEVDSDMQDYAAQSNLRQFKKKLWAKGTFSHGKTHSAHIRSTYWKQTSL